MREVNYEALREAAEKATKGCYIVGHTSGNQHGNITGVFLSKMERRTRWRNCRMSR